MDARFEISFRHFEPTDRIRERIDELIGELEKYEGDIISGRVVIDTQNRHGNKSVVEIAVELSHQGGMAVGRRSGEFPNPAGQQTFDNALTEAFHTAGSQIREHFRKRNAHQAQEPQIGAD